MAGRRLRAGRFWADVLWEDSCFGTLGNNLNGLMALCLFCLHCEHFLSPLWGVGVRGTIDSWCLSPESSIS